MHSPSAGRNVTATSEPAILVVAEDDVEAISHVCAAPEVFPGHMGRTVIIVPQHPSAAPVTPCGP